jgi:hypothetical protein
MASYKYEKEPEMRRVAKEEAANYDSRKIGTVSMALSPVIAYTLGVPLGLLALGGGALMHPDTRNWISGKLKALKSKVGGKKK